MLHQPEIVLLTASIDPRVLNTPMTVLINSEKRLNQYIDTIKHLIKNSDFEILIFCENTSYDFDYTELKNLALLHNKALEVIIFNGNSIKIESHGKGYGEGEIIKYAIENSAHLSASNAVFYKLTGRLHVDNVNELILKNKKKETIFIKNKANKPMVDTRFFKSSVSFFKKHLMLSYEKVDDLNGYYLEMAYYDALKYVPGIKVFSSYPKIKGMSGSTGLNYDLNTLKYMAYQACLKAGLLDINHL